MTIQNLGKQKEGEKSEKERDSRREVTVAGGGMPERKREVGGETEKGEGEGNAG